MESETSNPHLKRFVLLWIAMVALLAIVIFPGFTFLLLNWQADPSVHWVEEIRKRKFRASELCASGPRLLIAGGSSGHFSVDAELLEARLGIPTINLATHAGLGLGFLLEDARQIARSGDTVLLHLEGQHYRAKTAEWAELERKVVWTSTPWRLFKLPLAQALRQLYGNPFSDYASSVAGLNGQMQDAPVSAGYSFVTMGPRGDFRGTVPFRKKPDPARIGKNEGPGKEAARKLQEFFKWCNKRGVRVVGARPGVVRVLPEEPEAARRAFESIRSFYEHNKVPFLEAPELFQLPAELFFDTALHANAAGRRLITEVLAKELGGVLKSTVQQDEGAIFLVGSRDGGSGRALILANSKAPACRFISKDDLHHPLCVTPADISTLAGQKHRILFADPEVGALLEEAGISSAPIETKSAALKEWVGAYPDHLFALANVAGFNTTPLNAGLPEPFRTFALDQNRCKTAVFGTGRYSHFSRVLASNEKVELHLPVSEKWYSRTRLPMDLLLESTPAGASIRVMRESLVNRGEPGLAVAVIDPERGLVVKRGFFKEPALVEWELRQVQAGAL